LHPGCAPAAGGSGAYGFLFTSVIRQEGRRRLMLDPDRLHLMPALRHCLLARDLCPALVRSHLEIAAYADALKKSDARRAYLNRTLFLDPMNPEFWFQAGIMEIRDLHPDQAARDWRRSLELSDKFLKEILDRAAISFSPQDLIDQLLPENPRILIASANHLAPAPDDPRRLPFLNQARRLYETLSGPWQAEDLQQKAFVLASLNQPKEAVAAYREALVQKPLALEWRLQLARLLIELNREERVTLILVTHAPDLAARMKRVFQLQDGRLAGH